MKESVKKMSFSELYAAERAAAVICDSYRNEAQATRVYSAMDGTGDYTKYQELSSKLAFFNSIHNDLIKTLENKLKGLVENE